MTSARKGWELEALIAKAELTISDVYVTRRELRRLLEWAKERRRDQGIGEQRADPPNGRVELSSG